MKRIIFAALGAVLLAGCNQTVSQPSEQNEAPLAGGFGSADAEDAGTKKAEAMALDAIYEAHPTRMLAFVQSREVQVVAGLNYKFRIGMGGSETDIKKTYEVTVYRNLEGDFEVTRLTEVE